MTINASQKPIQRKIIHLDMDAFYASVEQRDNPDLQGKPVVVGGNPSSRGVVATASYEARVFGIRSAMSCYQAQQLCPQAVFVRPRFEAYRAVSQQIHQIMFHLTDIIEPLSLDEAYLDVSNNCNPKFQQSATLMAKWLQTEIFNQTHLTASAGVSFNKMLAKIASDIHKPNGITIITPEQAPVFIANLPIEHFHGIGKATAKRLHQMNVRNGGDLRNIPIETLIDNFGKRGKFYHDIAHARDNRDVKSQRKHKSIGSETTFEKDLTDDSMLLTQIYTQNAAAYRALKKKNKQAHTITLKIKYSNFTQITRSHTLHTPFTDEQSAHYWLNKLFADVPKKLPIRLVGVTYSGLSEQTEQQLNQLGLFE